ncbi:MAG: FCD domain-containing protein [Roseovarius sp.]|uniref:FCD domain-containing protein n=1 Tax=Alphaproteobacteria TaxID=28211 RepID=UPI0032EDE2B9
MALRQSLASDFDVALIYEANDRVHDTLISYCGNRFILNALDFHEPSGRMNEYRHYQDRARIRTACDEHIAIIDAVAAGEMPHAAELMRQHILRASEAGARPVRDAEAGQSQGRSRNG